MFNHPWQGRRPDALSWDAMIAAESELLDVAIAAQMVGERFDTGGRPFLTYCARQLEHECHETLDAIELLSTGWTPVT